MFKNISIMWTVFITLLITSSVPLALTAIIITLDTDINNQVTLIAGGIIGLILVISLWISQQITRPLRHLSKIAKSVEAGDPLDFNVLENISKGNNEISELAIIFGRTVIALQNQMVELNSIYTMGQTITSVLDYQKTLQTILAAVGQVVEFDAAEITIMRKGKLTVESWSGKETFNDTTSRTYKVGQGLTGNIAQTKKPVFMPTILDDGVNLRRTLGHNLALTELPQRSTKVEVKSYLGVPLLIGERLLGTLTLVHRKANHFTENDLHQLSNLMAQAAIALDNAIRVKQREQALQAKIRELTLSIDPATINAQVQEITETTYFRTLKENAKHLRMRKENKEN